jgi:hypothetical protein
LSSNGAIEKLRIKDILHRRENGRYAKTRKAKNYCLKHFESYFLFEAQRSASETLCAAPVVINGGRFFDIEKIKVIFTTEKSKLIVITKNSNKDF